MQDLAALLSAIWRNTVSLWSGLFGLIATLGSLYYANAPYAHLFLIAGLIALILSPAMAWREEHRIRLQLESVRPSVVIEAFPPGQIRAYAMANPANRVLPEGAYARGFMMVKSPTNEVFLYGFRNTGTVPAHEVRHLQRITVLDGAGGEKCVPLSEAQTGGDVLFPGQDAAFSTVLPTGTIFTAPAPATGSLRITLAVTYEGQPSDPNTYFHKIVLNAGRYHTVEEMWGRHDMGLVMSESSDEGVLKNNAYDLLR